VAGQRAVWQDEGAEPPLSTRRVLDVDHLEEVRRHRNVPRPNHLVAHEPLLRAAAARGAGAAALAAVFTAASGAAPTGTPNSAAAEVESRRRQKERPGDDPHVRILLQQPLGVPLQPQPVGAIVGEVLRSDVVRGLTRGPMTRAHGTCGPPFDMPARLG